MLFPQMYLLLNDVHTQQFVGWPTIRTAKAVVEFQIALWLSMKFSYNLIIWSVSILVSFVSDHDALGGYIYNLRPRTRSKGCVRACGLTMLSARTQLLEVIPAVPGIIGDGGSFEKSSLVQFGLRQLHLAWASLNRCELILLRRNTFTYLCST